MLKCYELFDNANRFCTMSELLCLILFALHKSPSPTPPFTSDRFHQTLRIRLKAIMLKCFIANVA